MSITTTLSGLQAAQKRVAVSATNIASSGAENFKALDLRLRGDNAGGVISDVVERQPQTADVSYDEELVQTQTGVNDFQANATVLAVQKKLVGSLLNILA